MIFNSRFYNNRASWCYNPHMSLQESDPKEKEPELMGLTFSGYFNRSSRFTGVSRIDLSTGQFVGRIRDDLGTADILGEKTDSKLRFVKLYRERQVNPYPITYECSKREEDEWEGQYSFDIERGHSIISVHLVPLSEVNSSVEEYKKELEETSKLIASRQREVVEREAESLRDGYYEPGNPRTVGLPAKPVIAEELRKFFDQHSSPEAIRRLSEGRDPAMNAIYAVFQRDALLSSFPGILDTIDFLGEVFPKFIDQVKGEEAQPGQEILFQELKQEEKPNILAEFRKDKSNFAVKLLSDFLLKGDGVVDGGQETAYIFVSPREKEVSYEYIGEEIMKQMRAAFSDDHDPKVKAFFGWVGRHLMKKVNPSTDFSLDRHNKMVEEDRAEILGEIRGFKERFEKGIEGEFTLENCYAFFNELRALAWNFPNILTAETPLQWRVQETLRKFPGYNDLTTYLPEEGERFGFGTENNFSWFVENWKKPEDKTGWSWRKSYTERFPQIFGDLTQSDSFDEGVLMEKWFQLLITITSVGMDRVERDTKDFVVTYFRFIDNRSTAEGYAYAQKHIEEILANLPRVVRLSEDEIKERFMWGMPPIFYDDDDNGINRSDEWKDQSEDERGWTQKCRIK